MAKAQGKPTWEVKPGSKEFRLSNVDNRATVDVGLTARNAGKLGPGWRSELWKGRSRSRCACMGRRLEEPTNV